MLCQFGFAQHANTALANKAKHGHNAVMIPFPHRIHWVAGIAVLAMVATGGLGAQETKKKKKKPPAKFSWVAPLPEARMKNLHLPEGLRHATFKSLSMGIAVGYYIYVPPEYDDPKNAERRYPVVYHLHGGRPGAESKSIRLAAFVDRAIKAGDIAPTLYVFPNGGPISWYNFPAKENGLGEDVLVKELIPHIDTAWRTTSNASGRAIEGFSQGGRGTTRIMFRYPELFASAAPGGSGYGPEKRIQENDGWESEKLRFLPVGTNTWDRAAEYARREDKPRLPILIWVGTKGFNYEDNLKFSAYLDELKVPHQMLVVEGVDHSAQRIYEKRGLELMRFHQRNFKAAAGD